MFCLLSSKASLVLHLCRHLTKTFPRMIIYTSDHSTTPTRELNAFAFHFGPVDSSLWACMTISRAWIGSILPSLAWGRFYCAFIGRITHNDFGWKQVSWPEGIHSWHGFELRERKQSSLWSFHLLPHSARLCVGEKDQYRAYLPPITANKRHLDMAHSPPLSSFPSLSPCCLHGEVSLGLYVWIALTVSDSLFLSWRCIILARPKN